MVAAFAQFRWMRASRECGNERFLRLKCPMKFPRPAFLCGWEIWFHGVGQTGKRPAKFNGRQAVPLTEEQARELKDHLMRLHTPKA